MLAAFALLRFVNYASAAFLFGASVMLAVVKPGKLAALAGADMKVYLRGAAFAGALAAAGMLPVQAATIIGNWNASVDPDVLLTVALHTRYGLMWCLRVAAQAIVLAMLFSRFGKGRALATVTGLALLPFALSGHAAMEEGWPGGAHAVVDMIHCLSAGFWLGALPVFLYFLKQSRQPALRPDALGGLMMFSTLGHIAVAVVLASGALNTWLILRTVGLDLAALYQRLLLLKALLVLSMVIVAVVNRYWWVPKIRARRADAMNRIRRNTLLEVAAGGAVLMLVAFLGLLSPQ
ncbi:hypothetical protein CAL26_10110 [Bordetella genomosp. 9]|uniref:Copper resistance protein D domain-containing protein n=1 Tax=Bordetella genomosp. 9 TaxID=1416803 RepID=A0A261RFR4_9BORD|nr:copper homeostasis membrane protein CopD [Bordetella genomosp. 9]OZI23771.1 hypothetical protein CAL26_10110 [Bordetella genomosp. 9]